MLSMLCFIFRQSTARFLVLPSHSPVHQLLPYHKTPVVFPVSRVAWC